MAFTKIVSPGIDTTGSYTVRDLNAVGVVTASAFSGPLTGNATGLTGTPDITVGAIAAASADFSGNVSIGGTLTYEDVTNIDSVGLITARDGIIVTGGSVGIGTDNANVDLHLHDSSLTRIQFTDDSTGAAAGDGVIMGLNGDDNFFINNRETSKEILLFTEDSERLRVTSGGNIGIGTDNPGTKLDILNGADANVIATVNGVDTSSEYLGLGINSGKAIITAGGNGSTSNALVFTTSNSGTESERVYITSGGSILQLGNGSASNPAITLSGTAPSDTLVTTSAGNIGIGTDNPSARLDVVSNNSSAYIAEFRQAHASNTAQIIIDSPVDGASRPSYMDYATGGTVKWRTGLAYLDAHRSFHIGTGSIPANSKLTIKPNGDVGIGTDNPSDKLSIYAAPNSLVFGAKDTTRGNHIFQLLADDGPGNGELRLYQNSGSGTHLKTVEIASSGVSYFNGGNIGIKVTNPDLTLHVNGVNALPSSSGSTPTGHLTLRAKAQSSSHGMFMGVSNAAPWSSWIQAQDANNNATNYPLLLNPNGGNVGINETNPSYRLHITETTSSSNYAYIQNTTAGNAGIRLKNSQGDYVVFVGPDFRVYDFTNSVDRLRIDSSGRILKGISSSILGSSDVQLAGSGGPAKIAGYKSDNNPTANNSMLTVTGYSQSGSTFTGIGEIDFRVNQNSNTASGYHPGSIVTRVNGGSTTGTHAGYTYSYAGLKDRERITFKSKRYYSLPEWSSGSDTYNTFREEWDYQHMVGYNQYSWYRFTSHSSSSSRGGSVDIRVTWSTRHAGGNGYGHYAFHWRDHHSNGYMEIGNVYRYHQNHLGGSYYGWTSSPQLDVYEINDSGNDAGFYLRVQGHISANSNTYDGGVMHQFLISAHTNRLGGDVNKFEFVGNSTPSDVGSIQGNVNLP